MVRAKRTLKWVLKNHKLDERTGWIWLWGSETVIDEWHWKTVCFEKLPFKVYAVVMCEDGDVRIYIDEATYIMYRRPFEDEL